MGNDATSTFGICASFTHCICGIGFIVLIIIGSLCMSTGEYCGPAGYPGGVAMVVVGSFFILIQIINAICICCIGVAAGLAFLGVRELSD